MTERGRYKPMDALELASKIRTTLFCPAIHCPSCVSYIESKLSSTSFRLQSSSISSSVNLQDITVSLIDRTISFSHDLKNTNQSESPREIANPSVDKVFTISLLRKVIESLRMDSYSIDSVRCKDLTGSNVVQSNFFVDPEDEESPQSEDIEDGRRHATKALLIPQLSKNKYKGYGSINSSNPDLQFVGSYPPPKPRTGILASLDRFVHPEQAKKEKDLQTRYEKHLKVCEACQNGQLHETLPEFGSLVEEAGERLEVKLAIGGMTCAACVSNVTSAANNMSLTGQEKLLSFEVNLLSSSAVAVVTHQSLVPLLVEAIEDSGYEVEVISTKSMDQDDTNPTIFKAKLSISGMTCAACVGNVSQAVESFKNVNQASEVELQSFEVALLDSSATAKLRTSRGKSEQEVNSFVSKLVEAIEDSGYDATLNSLEEETILNTSRSKLSQDSSRRRTVRIRIRGMFCQSCIQKVRSHLRSMSKDKSIKFSISDSSLSNISLASPEFECNYLPILPSSGSFTGREIISGLNSIDPAFSSEIVSPPSISKKSSQLAKKELQSLMIRLFIAFLFVIPTLIIGMVGPMLERDHPFHRWLSRAVLGGANRAEVLLWLLATPVEFGVGFMFWKRSWKGIKNVWKRDRSYLDRLFRWGDMNVLVVIGTGVAYFSSLLLLIIDIRRGEVQEEEMMTYFDASVFLIFFILLGRALEAWSKRKTKDAVSQLGSLKPSHGLLILDPSNPSKSHTSSTPVELLEIGDLVVIPLGSSPPLDSSLSHFNSENVEVLFNEASLTGESRPSPKKINDTLRVGTVNVSISPIVARIEALDGENMLDEILEVVRDASGKKANIEKLADKITGIFVPILVFVAIFVLCVWLVLLYSGLISQDWFKQHAPHPTQSGSRVLYAIQFAVSVIVVACPCGIGLAAPTAQMCGIGIASSKLGVLVNGGGSSFEQASKATNVKNQLVIIFDKTGTLTLGGEGQVVDHATFRSNQAQVYESMLWKCVALVEKQSTHPVAASLLAFCSQRGVTEDPSLNGKSSLQIQVEEVSGMGMKATIVNSEDNSTIELFIGNQRLLTEANVPPLSDYQASLVENWQSKARSVVFIASRIISSGTSKSGLAAPSLQAVLAIADPIRKEASQAIEILKQKFSAEIWMVSGDNEVTAKAVGKMVGIEEHRIIAGVLPTGKQEWVERLRSERGEEEGINVKKRIVSFVGDGINDSAAMVSSDFSLAMGGGSSIAHSSADFILLSSCPLLSIPKLLALSKATQRTILLNFAWAMLFNLSLIPIAAGSLVHFGIILGPSLSGLAMAMSSTSVVLCALTLNLWSPPKNMTPKI